MRRGSRNHRARDVFPGSALGCHASPVEPRGARRGRHCSAEDGARHSSRRDCHGRSDGAGRRRASSPWRRVRRHDSGARGERQAWRGRYDARRRHALRVVRSSGLQGRAVDEERRSRSGSGPCPWGRHDSRAAVPRRRDEAKDFWRAPVNATKGASSLNRVGSCPVRPAAPPVAPCVAIDAREAHLTHHSTRPVRVPGTRRARARSGTDRE